MLLVERTLSSSFLSVFFSLGHCWSGKVLFHGGQCVCECVQLRERQRSAIYWAEGVSYEGAWGLIVSYHCGCNVNPAVSAPGVSVEQQQRSWEQPPPGVSQWGRGAAYCGLVRGDNSKHLQGINTVWNEFTSTTLSCFHSLFLSLLHLASLFIEYICQIY